jgi:hypothetical protein
MPSPAVVDDHRVIDHIEVPVVIAVGPGTATVELGAGTREQFAGKTVGIATVVSAVIGSTVVVLVSIAIDNLIITAVDIARIKGGCA